jgi:lambda family phage tail tape measure protein
MASNIKVALQLDDRDYQTKLKSADASTKAFSSSAAASVGKINQAFGSLASGADAVRSKMETLGSAITGLAFAAFINNLLQSSAATKDLSEAFGLTLTSTLELEAGFKKAGRSSDDMSRVLATLSGAAQDANDGSFGLRDAFGKLGISMDFLKSNDLPSTIKQIAQVMKDNAGNTEILNAGYQVLGKTAKGMPMGDLLAGLQAASGQMGPAATATEAFDQALKTMESNVAAVTREFKILVTPVVDAFNALTQGADHSKTAAQALAIAMGVFAAGSVLVGINAVRNAILGLAGAFGLSTFATGAETTSLAANTAATIANAVAKEAGLAAKVRSLAASVAEAQAIVANTVLTSEQAVAQRVLETTTWRLVAAKAALAEASAIAGAATAGQTAATVGAATAATAATGAFAGMMASLGAMALAAARFLGVVALVTAAVFAVNAAVKAAFNFDPIDWFAKKLEKLIYDYLPALHSALEKVGSFFGMAPGTAAPKPSTQSTPTGAGFRTPGMGPQAIAGPGVDVATGNKPAVTGATLNPMAATEESLRAQARLRELNLKLDKDRLDLQLKMVGKDDYTRAVEQSALDFKIKQQQEVQRLTDDIRKMEITAANDKEGASKYGGQLAIMRQQLQTAKDNKDTTTELVGKIEAAKMVEKARLDYNAQITDQLKQQYDLSQKFQDSISDVRKAQEEANLQGNLIGAGPAFKQQVEIQRAARKSFESARDALMSGFNEESASADQIEEMVKRLSALSQEYDKLGQKQQQNLLDSRTWNAGWSTAFAEYAENAQNAADQAKTYFDRFTKGFEDAVVALVTNGKWSFKDFANSIIADFARIEARKALTSVMSGATPGGSVLGSLFNFGKSLFGFANGGSLMAGMPAIVGERGPELFIPSSAGKIVANNQLGNQAQVINNAVTYQIQAVDAASFRQLVAREPSFIYAVTEQGRRSQPSRRNA